MKTSKRVVDPSKTMIFSKAVLRDGDGHLINWEEWNEDVALVIAEEAKTVMKPMHWTIVYLLRRYYAEYHFAPEMRILAKRFIKELGRKSRDDAVGYLAPLVFELFGDDRKEDPMKKACKIAGLPKPEYLQCGSKDFC